MFRNVEYTGAYKEKFSTFPALISCMVSSFILNELLVSTGKINIRYPILTGDPGDRNNWLLSVLACLVTETEQAVCWSVQGSTNMNRVAEWLQ